MKVITIVAEMKAWLEVLHPLLQPVSQMRYVTALYTLCIHFLLVTDNYHTIGTLSSKYSARKNRALTT